LLTSLAHFSCSLLLLTSLAHFSCPILLLNTLALAQLSCSQLSSTSLLHSTSHHFAFNQFVFIFTRMQVGNKNHVFICNLPAKQTDQHPAMLHKPLKPRKALNKAFLKVKPK
jgi:hypothetical protein